MVVDLIHKAEVFPVLAKVSLVSGLQVLVIVNKVHLGDILLEESNQSHSSQYSGFTLSSGNSP
jgi:hypothetical protein